MALSLDGNTSFIGTEFIKLLNTGSSDLATVEYVDEQVAQGGGGGGNVDLSNYYTQTEVDTLLNNKLNVNNPQDITGTLRIDSTNGNGKLIVNAVGAPNDEDFYVNGLSNLGGTLKAQVIQASSNIQTSQQIQSNVINTYSNSNLIIQRNAIPYITLDSQIVDDETVEKIILMKDVEFSGGLSLNTLSVDTLNTIGLNDMVFNVATLGEFLRFQVSDNTVRVPNTRSFLSQDIYLDNLRPLTFSNDVVLYGGNNTNDAYEEYVRLDASAERVNITKATKFENNIQFNVGQNISWTNVFIREVQGTTRPEFDLIINGSTSHMRMWVAGAIKQAITNTTIACKVNIDAEQGLTVFNGQQLRTNIVNSNGNSDLLIQRDGSTAITLKADNVVQFSGHLHINNISTPNNTDLALRRSDDEYIRLFKDTSTLAEAIICSKQLQANSNIRVNNLQINQFASGVEYADFRLQDADSVVRFFVGNSTSANFQITNAGISLNRETTISSVKTNTINSNDDNDLVFQRNGTEFFRLNDQSSLVEVAVGHALTAPDIYANDYLNRTRQIDTVFYGSVVSADARVEYMRWNYANQSLDFNAPIDNTNIAVIGNIVDTTVSDERLKKNVQDVESNYCDCVKNVKIKTFEYKDEKYKNSDKYGMIAQDLRAHLPKEFKNIVKETKPKKDEGEAYLSINYMKLSLILWGCCQEQQSKIEHLESRLFELEDVVKELKGKGKDETKPKAKAKSKSKAKNVD